MPVAELTPKEDRQECLSYVMTLLLQMSGVTKRFGATLALDHATLTVARGEVHALLGENGSGKSTMMKIVAGIHRPDSGSITLDGQQVRFASPHQAARGGVAIVHQELNLVPVLSAAENVFLGQEPRLAGGLVNFSDLYRRTADLFRQLEIDVDPRVPLERLPVALRQMVEIARALTHKAKLLILDEPTSALSDSEVEVLFRIIRRLRSEGTSVVYISHKMAEIFALGDGYTVLRDGRTVATGKIAEVQESDLVQSMVGRQLGDYYPQRMALPQDKTPVLQVRNLRRPGSKNRQAVRDVSFTLHHGEIVGIAGLVGAGRTEILETIFGAAGENWSGEIVLSGKLIRPKSPAAAIDEGIALVTEDRASLGLFFQQSVLTNATVAELPRLGSGGFVSSSRERQALAGQSDTMRIRRASDQIPIESLSGGNQQKVILARWLMTNPKVLLLDEPTRGIDVGTKSEIYKVLRQLADAGMGVLFVSSELPEVLGLADRILVLSRGTITGEFAATDATEEKILHAAMAGFAEPAAP